MRKAAAATANKLSDYNGSLPNSEISTIRSTRHNFHWKRPSNGTIIPVTYITVSPDGVIESPVPTRAGPVPVMQEEYVCY